MSAISHLVSSALSTGGLAAFPIVFLGGLVSALNPCCLSMTPAVVALVGLSPARSARTAAVLSALFVCGFAVMTAAMGAATAALGLIFGHWGRPMTYLIAVIPLAMALKLWGVIELPALPHFRTEAVDGRFGAVIAGSGFALVIAPCATPILASILVFAASSHSVFYGTVLLFIYGIGLGAPLIALGSLLGSLHILRRLRPVINALAGGCLAALALYLLWTA